MALLDQASANIHKITDNINAALAHLRISVVSATSRVHSYVAMKCKPWLNKIQKTTKSKYNVVREYARLLLELLGSAVVFALISVFPHVTTGLFTIISYLPIPVLVVILLPWAVTMTFRELGHDKLKDFISEARFNRVCEFSDFLVRALYLRALQLFVIQLAAVGMDSSLKLFYGKSLVSIFIVCMHSWIIGNAITSGLVVYDAYKRKGWSILPTYKDIKAGATNFLSKIYLFLCVFDFSHRLYSMTSVSIPMLLMCAERIISLVARNLKQDKPKSVEVVSSSKAMSVPVKTDTQNSNDPDLGNKRIGEVYPSPKKNHSVTTINPLYGVDKNLSKNSNKRTVTSGNDCLPYSFTQACRVVSPKTVPKEGEVASMLSDESLQVVLSKESEVVSMLSDESLKVALKKSDADVDLYAETIVSKVYGNQIVPVISSLLQKLRLNSQVIDKYEEFKKSYNLFAPVHSLGVHSPSRSRRNSETVDESIVEGVPKVIDMSLEDSDIQSHEELSRLVRLKESPANGRLHNGKFEKLQVFYQQLTADPTLTEKQKDAILICLEQLPRNNLLDWFDGRSIFNAEDEDRSLDLDLSQVGKNGLLPS